MKSNKIALAGLLITAGLISLVAFTGKTVHKSFTQTEFVYDPTCCKDFIGVTNPANPLSLVESEIKNEDNWTGQATYCDNGNYLCAILFYLEFDADGGNDGELTLQEAIDALWDYYVTHSFTLPAHGNCFTVATGSGSTPAVVCVLRKSAH